MQDGKHYLSLGEEMRLLFPLLRRLLEYRVQTHNRAYGHGWIAGYDDTESDLNSFAGYLRQHGLAALWHYPSTDNPSTFIIYAAGTGQWSVLDGVTVFPPSAQLRIAVRSPLDSAPTNSFMPRLDRKSVV